MLFLLIATTYAQAVPAFPGLLKVRQPDGTSLTVRLIGDEFLNFYTTADGFSVVKNATGAFVYGMAVARDCGGGIKGNIIDLWFPDYETCIQWGRRDIVVYILG